MQACGLHRALYQEQICPQVAIPGWRVVKDFTTNCLINNWYEERLKFEKRRYKHDSTYRIDYKPFCSPTVDEDNRRKSKLHNETGLPLNILFHHHDDAYYRNSITWYDQTFSGRDAAERPGFLGERRWKIMHPAWIPERSDHPLQGVATNWGLLRQLQRKWYLLKEADDPNSLFQSVYHKSYNRSPGLPPGAHTLTRYATPREISVKVNPTDKINKDMKYFRSGQPEIVANIRHNPNTCEPKYLPVPVYN